MGCRVIIGCRRRLKQRSNTADSLVISFGLNENHGLNPSKEIRKMWAHYWCPLTGWHVSFFHLRLEAKCVDSPLLLGEVDIPSINISSLICVCTRVLILLERSWKEISVIRKIMQQVIMCTTLKPITDNIMRICLLFVEELVALRRLRYQGRGVYYPL